MSHSKFPSGDPQLPILDDFKAEEAEVLPPEPWWTRYFSYISLCGAAPTLAATAAFFVIARYRATDFVLVKQGAIAAGALALLVSFFICVRAESFFQKIQKQARQAALKPRPDSANGSRPARH
jgi:hypothetical protein